MSLTSQERQEWEYWITQSLFTFSSKPINSNALPVGVRPGPGRSGGYPHLSVSALIDLGASPGLDYVAATTSEMTRFKRLRQMLGEMPLIPKQPPQLTEPLLLDAYRTIAASAAEDGTQQVCVRLRQLKLPDGHGGYRVISPLASAGLAEMVNQEMFHRKELRDEALKNPRDASERLRKEVRVSSFQVGGSNPQNVGGRVRQLHRPLVLDNLPTTPPQLRHAFALFHRGLRLRLPKVPTLAYVHWWTDRLPSSRDQTRPYALTDKAQEKNLLRNIIQALHNQSSSAHSVLEASASTLFEDFTQEGQGELDKALASEFSSLDMGWLFLRHRDHAWKEDATKFVLAALLGFVVAKTEQGAPIHIDISALEQNRVRNLIHEVLS